MTFLKPQFIKLKGNSDPIKGALSLLSKKPPKIPTFPTTLDTFKDTIISDPTSADYFGTKLSNQTT